jgi:hypothetical protein
VKPETRIEVIDRQALISLPVRIAPVFIPHAVLLGVIVLASAIGAIMETFSWIAGV